MSDFSSLMQTNIVAFSPRPPNLSPQTENNWVAAAVAVVEAVVKMSKEMKFENWKADVSGKLREIISRLEAIQSQLVNLQIWIDERVTEESRRSLHRRIRSLASDINTILVAVCGQQGNVPNDNQLKDLRENFRDLRLTISDLQQTDGFSHVVGVIVGVVVAVPLFTLLDKRTELSEWSVDILEYFRLSLDDTNTKSLAYARNTAAQRYISEVADLDNLLNRQWKTNFTPFQDMRPLVGATDGAAGEGGGGGRDFGIPAHSILQSAAIVSESSITRTGWQKVKGDVGQWFPGLSKRYDCLEGAEISWADMRNLIERRQQRTRELAAHEGSLLGQMEAILTISRNLKNELA